MELIPFARLVAHPNPKPDFVGQTPFGQRVVVGVRDARITGDRLNASQRGDSAADWLLIGADGTAVPDVRMALKSDDGAFLYLTYHGRGDATGGIGEATIYTAVTFEVEDERYAWLNTSLFVGKGSIDLAGGVVAYDIYEMR